MDPSSDQITFEFNSVLRIYKDGRVERFMGTDIVPPSTDPKTSVQSKDIVISPEPELSARIFLPKITDPTRKIPLVVFFHGGAFCIESPFSPIYHNHAVSLAADANVVVFSVHYRRAPEHPLPIAYDDAWESLKWAEAHWAGDGSEEWLNDHVDFQRVFVGGDSAGANLAHSVVRRVRSGGLSGLRVIGLVSFHPFFGIKDPRDGRLDELMKVIFVTGMDDPRWKPDLDPDLGMLGCEKVVVFVAEKDSLGDRGLAYYEALKRSGWGGELELFVTEGEEHVFHLFKPDCEKAVALMNKVVSFINKE
ncbi:hypothetical protein UlMin_043410 [Ulmus minor]